jgi:nitrate reductase molybdenum cofactor assembly chaperone NarJ/NarW
MRLYKVLSILLDYPDRELVGHLDELAQVIKHLEEVSEEERQTLQDFLKTLGGRPLTDLQSDYVQTFDLTPDNTLHLTHHLFDEQDRARGPTLVKLVDYFKRAGLELDRHELPDHLPLLLEYASILEDGASARTFLRETSAAVAVIAENLEKIASPYAPLLRIVEQHGQRAVVATVATA